MYFMLVERFGGEWFPQFGDKDRETVCDERKSRVDMGDNGGDLLIIRANSSRRRDCERSLKELNESYYDIGLEDDADIVKTVDGIGIVVAVGRSYRAGYLQGNSKMVNMRIKYRSISSAEVWAKVYAESGDAS